MFLPGSSFFLNPLYGDSRAVHCQQCNAAVLNNCWKGFSKKIFTASESLLASLPGFHRQTGCFVKERSVFKEGLQHNTFIYKNNIQIDLTKVKQSFIFSANHCSQVQLHLSTFTVAWYRHGAKVFESRQCTVAQTLIDCAPKIHKPASFGANPRVK